MTKMIGHCFVIWSFSVRSRSWQIFDCAPHHCWCAASTKQMRYYVSSKCHTHPGDECPELGGFMFHNHTAVHDARWQYTLWPESKTGVFTTPHVPKVGRSYSGLWNTLKYFFSQTAICRNTAYHINIYRAFERSLKGSSIPGRKRDRQQREAKTCRRFLPIQMMIDGCNSGTRCLEHCIGPTWRLITTN